MAKLIAYTAQLALEANRNNLNLMRERSTKIGQVKR